MDWKKIVAFSQSGEDVDERIKDELLNAIAWHDFDMEEMDLRRYSALVNVCQTIMKYKSDQVIALLEELDELAKKQGESETRLQESDDRSSKSKKSFDSDEQDIKYRQLKSKYRKLQTLLESSKRDNEKLKENVKLLEQERIYLQTEIRNTQIDDTASDVSERVKDQQKDLIENVQQKNAQISQLLTDIENVESDNLQMRARLSTLRDEFATATEKLEVLINENALLKVNSDEANESNAKMHLEIASLKDQVEDLLKDKASREVEFDEFAKEIDGRIEDWKIVLEAKNTEIEQLKSRTNQTFAARPSSSTSSSLPLAADNAQFSVLQQSIVHRDEDIVRLQKQLETATKEITKTAIVLTQVTKERDAFNAKCDKSNDILRDLKKQLKSSHARCQDLIDDVQYNESLIHIKDQDIRDLIEKISEKNTKKLLKEQEQIKSQKRVAEKKVAELVKSCNKLRTSFEKIEKENISLRNRLGLSEDEFVSTTFVTAQSKLQRKQFDGLRYKLEMSEEEKLQYRMELQKLSKIISNLSEQLIELGEHPRIDEETQSKTEKTNVMESEDASLLEENDALRKGLHEILASVQSKQESSVREIRSETLESLLRALDAKHVSGWYHPAMRLQAEVHALQGSNMTLREQLRTCREELDAHKESTANAAIINCTLDSSNAAALANLNNHLVNVLKDYKVDDITNAKLLETLENYKQEFLLIQERVGALFNQYTDEKKKWDHDFEMLEGQLKELTSEKQSLADQLSVIQLLTDPQTEEEMKIKNAAETAAKLSVMNRKLIYMENVDLRYRKEIIALKDQLLRQEQDAAERMQALKADNVSLTLRMEQSDFLTTRNFISEENITKLQHDYDDLLNKYRGTLQIAEDISKVHQNEIELLRQKVVLLQGEKEELQQRSVACKGSNELQARLAQSEMNETIERQRADHTNSLYELVKDQLAKSEERQEEYQKQAQDVAQKNQALQESVKTLEDKVSNLVDAQMYTELENKYVELMKNCQKHAEDARSLQDELTTLRKDSATRLLWSNMDQCELHGLRHLLVDLQATSDDKVVIARLSSDVVTARMSEAETRKKLDEVSAEIIALRIENKENILKTTAESHNYRATNEAMRKKISLLEMIIKQQRSHYFGYIPMTSQRKFVEHMHEIASEKRKIHESLTRTEHREHESQVIRETLEMQTEILNELNVLISSGSEQAKALEKWFLDKTNIQLQELRCRRQTQFKEAQLKQSLARHHVQEAEIEQLQVELLQTLSWDKPPGRKSQMCTTIMSVVEIAAANKREASVQTTATLEDPGTPLLKQLQSEIEVRNEEMRLASGELEASLAKNQELRQQIADKQSQIAFYEKHILEQQQQKKDAQLNNQLQQTLKEKERAVFELQSLLKKDRDEHSLAAARFQDELKVLQARLAEQEQQQKKPAPTEMQQEKPARTVIEFYIQQVHALEKHTMQLQTSESTLNSQLQSSREECARWKSLANDRLQSVDDLRLRLEDQHRAELDAYRSDSEQWRNEVNTLQAYINAHRKEITDLRPSIEKELKEKDNKIHELLITLRQLKAEVKRKVNTATNDRAEDFEEVKENLLKEQDVLRKRCEQLLNREKTAREEIRSLKGQLMKRPITSARSDAGAGIKEVQQKRIAGLEKELEEMREKLDRESALNDIHRAKVNEDFDRWSKQKYWQQQTERTKAKLREKTDEYEKLQQTCASYRMLIERLEREKHNLEMRVKNFKVTNAVAPAASSNQDIENAKLREEISSLRSKLEQQMQHSGALSTAMLQEKLEAQERKIAVLELSAKGGGEVRMEMERLQTSNTALQRSNLRLEAENLELQLDREKSTSELPHLREQIKHLENYVGVLQRERNDEHKVTQSGDHTSGGKCNNDLERTVSMLKRTVERLQVENKRLASGGRGKTDCTNNSSLHFKRISQQNEVKIAGLEEELRIAKEQAMELEMVKGQLIQKTQLLEKIKVLLQRAAIKEKALLDEVTSLKAMLAPR